jgi:DNA-binding NarL/FixJ family response regulator
VPDSKTLKLLLVEDDLEDEQLLCEALIEIEENRQWCNWRSCGIVHVAHLADAVHCLRQERFDVVLLNLSLPDSPALIDTFLDLHAAAGETPIVVLADAPDENLANRLLREGAQDILTKSELECEPLARAIRYAIERQRRAQAVRASALIDDLTGVLSREAFLSIATHYLLLSLQLLAASLEVISNDRDARKPLLIHAAEVLGAAFEAPCIIGRWHPSRFCVLTAGLTRTTVEAILYRAAASIGVEVRFSVTPVDARADLDEILSGELRALAKTAILAD